MVLKTPREPLASCWNLQNLASQSRRGKWIYVDMNRKGSYSWTKNSCIDCIGDFRLHIHNHRHMSLLRNPGTPLPFAPRKNGLMCWSFGLGPRWICPTIWKSSPSKASWEKNKLKTHWFFLKLDDHRGRGKNVAPWPLSILKRKNHFLHVECVFGPC